MQNDLCPVCKEYCNPSGDGSPVHDGACTAYREGGMVGLLEYAKGMYILRGDSSVCDANARIAVSLAQRLLTQRPPDLGQAVANPSNDDLAPSR